jgi:hypothetical protein
LARAATTTTTVGSAPAGRTAATATVAAAHSTATHAAAAHTAARASAHAAAMASAAGATRLAAAGRRTEIAAAVSAGTDLGHYLLLVPVDLERTDIAIVIHVQHGEEAHRIGEEFGPAQLAVMIGIDAGEPQLLGMIAAAKRLPHRADEEAAETRRLLAIDDDLLGRIMRLADSGGLRSGRCGAEQSENSNGAAVHRQRPD